MTEAQAEAFKLVSWNWIYYRCYISLLEDLPWTNTLLDMIGPTHAEIKDINGGIFNYFCNEQGLNVYRSYNYLVKPRVGEVIARWRKER